MWCFRRPLACGRSSENGLRVLCVQYQHGFGFDLHAFRQGGDTDGGAGGEGFLDELCHDFVEDGEVGKVGQVGVEFDDVAQRAACGLSNGLQVFKDLTGFSAEIAISNNGHGGGIEGDLTAHVNGVARAHGLAVCADGGGGFVSVNDGFGHDFLLLSGSSERWKL